MDVKETRAQKRDRISKTIENYLSSGKTQKQFCHENHLNPHNFQFWLKRYRRQHQITASESEKTVPRNFISVQPSLTSNIPYPCIIEYPNGLRLLLERPDIDILRELLNQTGN
jgi:hypothetical protein